MTECLNSYIHYLIYTSEQSCKIRCNYFFHKLGKRENEEEKRSSDLHKVRMEVPHPEILVPITSLEIITPQYKPTSRHQILYREQKQAINRENYFFKKSSEKRKITNGSHELR